jgi:hypothetical protein
MMGQLTQLIAAALTGEEAALPALCDFLEEGGQDASLLRAMHGKLPAMVEVDVLGGQATVLASVVRQDGARETVRAGDTKQPLPNLSLQSGDTLRVTLNYPLLESAEHA